VSWVKGEVWVNPQTGETRHIFEEEGREGHFEVRSFDNHFLGVFTRERLFIEGFVPVEKEEKG
jgi:hypothetical protein